MMESVVASTRKPVTCRYFAASGTCFYGDDCQFLHTTGASSASPTPFAAYMSPARNRRRVTDSRTPVNGADADPSAMMRTQQMLMPSSMSQMTAGSNTVETLARKTQGLAITDSAMALFEEQFGGTTYYYAPDEQSALDLKDEGTKATDESSHHATSPSHSYNTYAGPPSFLQSLATSQRPSYFVNEELRLDILQRNALAVSTVDPSLFPDLPEEVDHYRELAPLEPQTLSQAVKSHTFGLVTSTYKAVHTKTGLRYCLKRIHGYRVSSAKCLSIVELWRKVEQCHVVTLREVFTTKAFGDHSMVFVYDYFPGAETLQARHFSSSGSSLNDPFSSDPSAPRPYTLQKNKMLQQQAGKGLLPEGLLWSYIIELASALRAIHSASLAARCLNASKVLVTSRGKVRICGGAIFDVLSYDANAANPMAVIPHYQQEDLLAFGNLILALACNSLLALQRDNLQTSMDIVTKNYSPDLRNLVMYLLSTSQNRTKSIQEVMPMIGARFFSQLEATTLQCDVLEDQLARELDNGRLFRLLAKLGTIIDRPELNMDNTWSETGDRYLLKLFRDYLLHPVTEDGRPWIDLAHIVSCLNRLDSASHDKICLTSRDNQNVLVVSYAELHQCLQNSFAELEHAALAPVNGQQSS